MNRLIVFLVILSIAYCHNCKPGSPCPWRNRHNHSHGFGRGPCSRHIHEREQTPQTFPGTTFEEIASNVIKIDKAIKNFCDVNNINRTSEIYGNEHYILKYNLPEFEEGDIDVKIMNRMMYTTAIQKYGNLETFKDLRILPDVVSAADAKWVVEHKTLKVFVPYKTNWRNNVNKDCNVIIDEMIKNVPKMVHSGFGFRNGPGSDESTETNIIHFEENEIH